MAMIRFDEVSKHYRLRQEQTRDVRHKFLKRLQSFKRGSKMFWALKDISFKVRSGEALGIIGPNGSGKTTILKLLSGITAPTEGEILVGGRLSALIDIGSGFHPELTGRENIYLNGSILGMRRREISGKLDSITEFAGIGKFIDMPVKWYSSGMYVRLGFSISAHLDSDILLLDEVLAVGDANFQAKCLEYIKELKREGKTILLISHDLVAIENLCDRAMLLKRGEILAEGLPHDVVAKYQAGDPWLPEWEKADTQEPVESSQITDLAFFNSEGNETVAFCTGEPLVSRIEYMTKQELDDVVFSLFFYSKDGKYLHCQCTTAINGERLDLGPGVGAIEFRCHEVGLQPGRYIVGAALKARNSSEYIALLNGRSPLFVEPGKMVYGNFYMPHEWRVVDKYQSDEKSLRRDLTGQIH